MPWNVVDKLEKVFNDYTKTGNETITLKNLEQIIILNLGVTRSETIERYILLLLKLDWIEKIKKDRKKDYSFKIKYKNEKELF